MKLRDFLNLYDNWNGVLAPPLAIVEVEAKKNFALEVADILEGKSIKVKVRKHNENRN